MTISPEQARYELDHVLAAIQSSRHLLIRVVNHLQRLHEMATRERTQSQGYLSTSNSRWSFGSSSSTDTSIASPKPEKKPQTIGDMLAQFGLKRKRSITHYEGIPIEMILPPPEVAPANRKLVTSRRIKQLDKAMSGLHHGPPVKDVEMSPDEDEEDSDSDDDDDDLVIII